jgi:hypothetical protein
MGFSLDAAGHYVKGNQMEKGGENSWTQVPAPVIIELRTNWEKKGKIKILAV